VTPSILLYPAQVDFLNRQETFVGFVGGIGSGKSFVLCYDMLMRASHRSLFMIVAPTFPMLRDATLRSFFDVTERLGIRVRFHKTEHVATLPTTGAEILFRSADNPESLRGPNLSGVGMDEASLMDRSAFDVLIGRLRQDGNLGFFRAAFTPKGKTHWSYDVFGREQPNTSLVRARTSDNPFLPDRFYETVRGQYTSALAEQELEGQFLDTAGCLFRRGWFGIVDAAPTNLSLVRAWDLAATEQKKEKANDPDYTAGVLMGRSNEGVYYVLDVRCERASPAGIEALVRQTAELDGRSVPILMEQEPGSAGVNTIDNYLRRILAGFNFRGERATGDKVTRAHPFAAMAEAGNVKIIRGAWNKPFLDEVELFPLGPHDDQVDSASRAFARLALHQSRKLQVWG